MQFILKNAKKKTKHLLNKRMVIKRIRMSSLPVIFFFSLYYAKEYSYYFSFFITVLLSSLSYFLIENKFKDIIINFSLKKFFIKYIIIATFFLIIAILIMSNFPFIKNEILKNNYLEKKYSLTIFQS
jgi:hypothetical protein